MKVQTHFNCLHDFFDHLKCNFRIGVTVLLEHGKMSVYLFVLTLYTGLISVQNCTFGLIRKFLLQSLMGSNVCRTNQDGYSWP